MNTIQNLKQFSLLQSLTDRQLNELAGVASNKDFKAGETIIEEGEEGSDVFLIYEGSVRIYRLSESGKEIALAVKGKGDIIGEMALFGRGIRSAFAEAIEDTKTFKIKKADFENFLKASQEMSIELLKILSSRIEENDRLIESLTAKHLKDRVSSVILALHSYMPHIKITQEQIASLTGATRPRVSEVLAELTKEGFLDIREHELIVLQRTE